MPTLNEAFEFLESLPDRLTRAFGFEPPTQGVGYHLYRSVYHLVGGALVGLATCWNAWVCFAAGNLLLLAIIYNEYRDVRDGGDVRKSLLDITVWFTGFWIVFMSFYGRSFRL